MFFHLYCSYMRPLGHKSAASCNGPIKLALADCWILALHAQPIPAFIWRASGARHCPSNQSLVCCTCHASILFLQCTGHLPTIQSENRNIWKQKPKKVERFHSPSLHVTKGSGAWMTCMSCSWLGANAPLGLLSWIIHPMFTAWRDHMCFEYEKHLWANAPWICPHIFMCCFC
jgi:hypothetical protein